MWLAEKLDWKGLIVSQKSDKICLIQKWHDISFYMQMYGKTPIFKCTQEYHKDSYNLAQRTINIQGPKPVLFASDTDIQVKAI
jgi:hypothetical protein